MEMAAAIVKYIYWMQLNHNKKVMLVRKLLLAALLIAVLPIVSGQVLCNGAWKATEGSNWGIIDEPSPTPLQLYIDGSKNWLAVHTFPVQQRTDTILGPATSTPEYTTSIYFNKLDTRGSQLSEQVVTPEPTQFFASCGGGGSPRFIMPIYGGFSITSSSGGNLYKRDVTPYRLVPFAPGQTVNVQFERSGEEIQIPLSASDTAPTRISLSLLPDVKYDIRVDDCLQFKLFVPQTTTFSKMFKQRVHAGDPGGPGRCIDPIEYKALDTGCTLETRDVTVDGVQQYGVTTPVVTVNFPPPDQNTVFKVVGASGRCAMASAGGSCNYNPTQVLESGGTSLNFAPLGCSAPTSSGYITMPNIYGTSIPGIVADKYLVAEGIQGCKYSIKGTVLLHKCPKPAGVCGDSTINAGEQCDGTNLAGQTCASQGFLTGTLKCKTDCTLDKTGCSGKAPVTVQFDWRVYQPQTLQPASPIGGQTYTFKRPAEVASVQAGYNYCCGATVDIKVLSGATVVNQQSKPWGKCLPKDCIYPWETVDWTFPQNIIGNTINTETGGVDYRIIKYNDILGTGTVSVSDAEAKQIGRIDTLVPLAGIIGSVFVSSNKPEVLVWVGGVEPSARKETTAYSDTVFACVDNDRNLQCDYLTTAPPPPPAITIPTGSTRVDITNGVCSPATLTINVGGSITFVNNDAVNRIVQITKGTEILHSRSSPAGQPSSIEFTAANAAGDYRVTCPSNQQTLTVQAPTPTPTAPAPTAPDLTIIEEDIMLLEEVVDDLELLLGTLKQQAASIQDSLTKIIEQIASLTSRVAVLEGRPVAVAPAPVAPAPAIVAAPVLRVLTPTIESTQQNPVQISFVAENFKVEDGGNHLHFVLDDLGKVNKFSQQQLKDMMPTLVDNTVSQFGVGGLKMPMLLDSAGGVRLFMHYSNEPYKLPDLTDGKYLLRAELVDKAHNSLSPAVEQLVPFTVKAPVVARPAVVEVPRPFNFVLSTDELGSERERVGSTAKTGDTLVLRNTGNRELTLWTSATTQPFKVGAGQASTQITLEPAGTFTLVIPENDLIYKIPITNRACNEDADCTKNEKCTGNKCKPIEGTCTGGIKLGQCSGNRVCLLREGAYSLLEDKKCQQQLVARDSLFEPTGPYLVLRKTGTISFMKQPRFDRGLKSVPGAPQSFETPIIAPGSSATVSGLQPGRIPFGLNEEINACTPQLNPNHCGTVIVMDE